MQEKLPAKTAAAAIEYLGRKQRVMKPRGEVRGTGWWPTDTERQPCCKKTPYPSGINQWAILKHCCTGPHVAKLHNCDERVMKRWSRVLEKNGAILRKDHYTLLWQLRKSSRELSPDELVDVLHVWERESNLRDVLEMGAATRKLAVELVKSGVSQADAVASARALSSPHLS